MRTHNLQAVTQFYDSLKESEADRRFIFQAIDLLDPAASMTEHEIVRVRNVVNFFNKIGMLMDMGLMPQKFVLGMTHTLIIRSCFILMPYAASEEAKLGGATVDGSHRF